MNLSPESLNVFRTLMSKPKDFNLDFKSLSELMEEGDTIIAKHVLYEEYLLRIKRKESQLPKIFFYLVIDELYEQGVSKEKEFGYYVKWKE